jgi:hypothetical protein
MVEYRRMRNEVNRTAKRLQHNYCDSAINSLCNSNPRTWWRNVKKLNGHLVDHSFPLVDHSFPDIAKLICGGNLTTLSNMINNILQQVSSDLNPLSVNLCRLLLTVITLTMS